MTYYRGFEQVFRFPFEFTPNYLFIIKSHTVAKRFANSLWKFMRVFYIDIYIYIVYAAYLYMHSVLKAHTAHPI